MKKETHTKEKCKALRSKQNVSLSSQTKEMFLYLFYLGLNISIMIWM